MSVSPYRDLECLVLTRNARSLGSFVLGWETRPEGRVSEGGLRVVLEPAAPEFDADDDEDGAAEEIICNR